MIETGGNRPIYSVAFHPDGMHLLSGNKDGVRRWRVADGLEVGNRIEMDIVNAISVSRDGKWIVCGTEKGASVWDAKIREKAIAVEGAEDVNAVDISPESTRFATAAGGHDDNKAASIWNIITGERLVGPLQHDNCIIGIKFSPNGEHIATAIVNRSIHVLDSRNGDQLITIKTDIPGSWPSTPLAWSNNGQQVFAASRGRKTKSFDVSTGSQLAESEPEEAPGISIDLATNGKFLAQGISGDRSISFCDTSTLTRIGPDSQYIYSIALSPDCSHVATGGRDGNITIRNLNNIPPDVYGPFCVSVSAFTILSDTPHTVFPPPLDSPLGDYSGRTRIGKP